MTRLPNISSRGVNLDLKGTINNQSKDDGGFYVIEDSSRDYNDNTYMKGDGEGSYNE
jgi:hypothetical protein